jgi:hypothetical protein
VIILTCGAGDRLSWIWTRPKWVQSYRVNARTDVTSVWRIDPLLSRRIGEMSQATDGAKSTGFESLRNRSTAMDVCLRTRETDRRILRPVPRHNSSINENNMLPARLKRVTCRYANSKSDENGSIAVRFSWILVPITKLFSPREPRPASAVSRLQTGSVRPAIPYEQRLDAIA